MSNQCFGAWTRLSKYKLTKLNMDVTIIIIMFPFPGMPVLIQKVSRRKQNTSIIQDFVKVFPVHWPHICCQWFKFIFGLKFLNQFDVYFSFSYVHYHILKQMEIKIKLL